MIRFLTARFSRQVIGLTLSATIPILVAGIWVLNKTAAGHLRSAAVERLASAADILARRVDAWGGAVARNLQLLSVHPDLVSMDPARQRRLLQQLRKIYPQITYAHTIGPSGINVARTDDQPPLNYRDRKYFQRVMAGAPIAWETLGQSRSTGHPALNQAAPIINPAGKIVGVVVLGMNLNSLAATVGVGQCGRTGYSCVVDRQGRALAHPEHQYAATLCDLRQLPPVRGAIGRRVSSPYRFQDERGTWWLSYAVPAVNGWSAISFQQEDEVLAAVRETTALAVLVTAIVIALKIGFTWAVTRRIVRPIRDLTATAIEIADGNWKRRIPQDRRDELGALAKAFNRMVDQLEASNRALDEKVVQLSTALAEGQRAQEQLTTFSLAVQQSPASVVITNPQGTIEYVNPKFTEVTGYTAAEAVGHSPRVLKSGFHPPEFYHGIWNTLGAGGQWRGEICNRRKDGTLFWELTSICPIRNAQGEIAHLMAVKEDVTEQKRVESERQAAHQQLQDIIEFLPDATFVIDRDKRVIAWNRALEEMTGVSKADMIGKGDLAYAVPFYGERRPILVDLLDGDGAEATAPYDYVNGRQGTLLAEVYIPSLYRGAGAHVWIAATALLDKDGRRYGAIESVRDVSAHKRAEEALRKKEEEFRQSQKLEAVGSLAGGIAHEFNNLLQAIQAFTTFAVKGLAPEEQRYQDLQEVLQASARAATLTRQLLGFSRRQQFQPIDIEPNQILVSLEKMLRPLIGENIDLQLILGDRLGRWHADPTMIQQVVMNLCINARDAMPGGGKLLIQTEAAVLDADDCRSNVNSRPGRYVRVTVSDTGAGMPPDVLGRIFEPFFTTKEIGKGTGLGLSMVYGVVQQHGGMIHVRSEPGQGSTFEIYLPAVEAAAEATVAAPPGAVRGGSETILMAEDDPLVRAALVRVLAEAGYRVLAAADGEEAVKVFAANSAAIGLVLLDMMMPKMGGREAHARIAEINPDTPVVYCTGYDSGLAKLDPAAAAALCVVQKPVDPPVLLTTIRETLDRRLLCPAE